jgi:hypothetical protein
VNVPKALPGEHLALLTDNPEDALEGRTAGLELRDCLLVLRPGPTASFVFLFRKPLDESTLADQVAKTGTGGINIAACRIATSEGDAKAMERANTPGSGRMKAGGSPIGTFIRSSSSGALDTSAGRWPPNVVFIHAPGCVRTGSRRVPTGIAYGVAGREKNKHGKYNTGLIDPGTNHGYADEDGLETVAAYDCAPGCPVPILDELSGERPVSGAAKTGVAVTSKRGFGFSGGTKVGTGTLHNDSGGASRFFPQFESEPAFFRWLGRLIGSPLIEN